MSKRIQTLKLDRWSEPDESRRVKHLGMIKAQDAFDQLKAHLEKQRLVPDDYFLFNDNFSRFPNGELPNSDEAICKTNFGGSEGIYLDIYFEYEGKSIPFATGKTLGETAEDFYRMARIGAECSIMLNGRGRSIQAGEKKSTTHDPIWDDPNFKFHKAPITDTYTIYQLSDSDTARDKHFMPFSPDRAVLASEYTQVYKAELMDNMTLDSIFQKFNTDIPPNFKGHSLSVSDIVVLNRDGKENAYYVDSFGFEKLPQFMEDLQNVQSEKSKSANNLSYKSYNLIATYEELFKPEKCTMIYWGDYGGYVPQHGVSQDTLNRVYEQALNTLGVTSEAFESNERYIYRGNTVIDICTKNNIPFPQYIQEHMAATKPDLVTNSDEHDENSEDMEP